MFINLLHWCKVESDVSQEGEGELHPGVEKQVDEVSQSDLLQIRVLLLRKVRQARKPILDCVKIENSIFFTNLNSCRGLM